MLVLGLAFYIWKGGNQSAQLSNEEANLPQQTEENQSQEDAKPTYSYQYIPNTVNHNFTEFTEATYDGKIVRTDLKTNAKETVVPSVKKAYPAIKPINLSFEVLSAPKNSSNIYFTVIPNETDGFPFDIIRYNGEQNTFTKLKTSTYFDSPGVRSGSKNSAYVASTENPQNGEDERSLFLIDLETDTAKLLTKLPANETFNSCYEGNCLGGWMGQIEWLSESTFQISVYDANATTTDEQGYGPVRKLIAKRKFTVK